jgi:uncharacterized ParB-like nuclease family protein
MAAQQGRQFAGGECLKTGAISAFIYGFSGCFLSEIMQRQAQAAIEMKVPQKTPPALSRAAFFLWP